MSDYTHGPRIWRDRREPIPDGYNPARQTVGSWGDYVIEDNDGTIELPNCYLAASSTTAVPDAIRKQSYDYRSLYTRNAVVDVQIGDRIRDEAGNAYYVDQRPSGDVNPFTGWAPGVEIPLRGEVG